MFGVSDEILKAIVSAVIAGGISSSVITYYFGAKRSEREVLRVKLESLYIDISQSIRSVHSKAGTSVMDIRNFELGYKTFDETFSKADDSLVSIDRYTSVISIYFPDSSSVFHSYWSTYQAVNAIWLEVMIPCIDGKPPQVTRHQEMELLLTTLAVRARDVHIALLYEAAKISRPFWRRIGFKKRKFPDF